METEVTSKKRAMKDSKEAVVTENSYTQPARHTFSTTAWSYWNEWKDVYELLFSTSPLTRRRGINRVSAWRSRVGLPVSVESTVALVEAIITDDCSNSTSSLSVNSIKSLYASAITRLVNGILDAKQIAHHPVPLTILAAENNFPQYLVDVRHQVSHSADLPSLQALRLAADIGLHYLKTMYWERQKSALSSLHQSIYETLQKYKQIMQLLIKSGQLNTTSHSQSGLQRIAQVKRCIEEITLIANPNLVQEVLVPLLLSSKDGEHFMLPPGQYTNTTLPKEFQMWHIALRKFSHVWSHFPVTLLLTLVNQIVDSSTDIVISDKNCPEYNCNTLRTTWIGHIMRNYYPKNSTYAVPLISIANICLKNMNIWTKLVLSHIYDYDNKRTNADSPGRWEALKEISELKRTADALRERNRGSIHMHKKARVQQAAVEEVSVNLTLSSSPIKSLNIATLEQLLSTKSKPVPEESESITVWKLSTQYPTSTPLGVSPSGNFPNLDLPDTLDLFQQARFLSIQTEPVVQVACATPIVTPAESSINQEDRTEQQHHVPEQASLTASMDQGHTQIYVNVCADGEPSQESDVETTSQESPSSVNGLFLMYKELF